MISGTRETGGAMDAGARAREAARAGAARFAEVLQAARRAGAGREGAAAGARPRRDATRPAASKEGEARLETALARADGEARQRGAEVQAAASVEALRAAVRALPAAVEAVRLASRAQVALAFGPALGVELRSGSGGVEVTLRPGASLERAAAAELPGLVAALRARGLRIARAEVLGRGDARAPGTRLPPRHAR